MKVFLDTNLFLEYFEQRREYQAVSQLLSAVEDGKVKAVVSVGCLYTLAYLVRVELKRQGIHRPEQTLRLRSTLNTVMSMVTAGFQHQCAIQNKCDAFVTINLRDYSNADTSKMKILSPTEFVEKYL